MATKTRSIEREIFIDADIETVWRAITEAREIVHWFAPIAESKPGVGGYIQLDWNLNAADPSHDVRTKSPCHIVEWEAPHRLLMTWRDAPGGEHELPVEIRLSRRDSGTLLRLVHSGFLSDASWDEEFESHGRGWSYELRSLRFYLEHQLGRTRRYVLDRFPISGDVAASWRAAVGTEGAFRVALDGLAEGAEFLLGLPNGATTGAELLFAFKERDFVAIASVLQGGLFRLALETLAGVPEIRVWAFSWNLSDTELRALATPMFAALRARVTAARSKSRLEAGPED